MLSSPTVPLDTAHTSLIATFPTRRHAEQAKDRLDRHGIRAMVTADDAGGVHLDLQHVHGVCLRVLENDAHAACQILGDTHLLPRNEATGGGTSDDASLLFSKARWAEATSRAALVLFVVMVAIIVGGLLFSTLQ